MQSTLYFYGGAGAVTGSNFLLDTGGAKFLIDCGLRQGMEEEKNWEPFQYNPADISHLLVTHAHLDHIGRIPRLVRQGFRGKIISTKATLALAAPMLADALAITTHSAERSGREPLYEDADISAALGLWSGISYHEKVALPDGVELELFDAGHILGSAMVQLSREGRSIVFTGDIGGGNSPLLPPTEAVGAPAYLVMESTYGDRARPEDAERRERLEDIIEDSVRRGGTLLIPAFSTERTQDLMYEIRTLMVEKRVPSVPVFLDSPLAEKITAAFVANPEYFSPAMRTRVEGGEKIFDFPELHFVASTEASQNIHKTTGPKIILAGSGMSSGGRVLAHERVYLPDPDSTLLVVGYQAAGTLGRQLIEGAKNLKLHKESIPVRAKVATLYGYSAHRDGEGLLEFANKAGQKIEEIFAVHGEPAAAGFLVQRIRDYLGVKASAPEAGDRATINL
ncbi:MBL fold metallo-hydrolase [Candidatus Kaiserbacteria bacterium]|nr:MBL fold metallo-hydrolase [Candidatus Kaiserbacteria bacterium]